MNNDLSEKTASLPPLLTPKEAAAVLRLEPHTLAVWRCRRPDKLPFVKVGGAVRYRLGDVAQLAGVDL